MRVSSRIHHAGSPTGGAYPDLLGIDGDATNGYALNYYVNQAGLLDYEDLIPPDTTTRAAVADATSRASSMLGPRRVPSLLTSVTT